MNNGNESDFQDLQTAVFGCEETQQQGLNNRMRSVEQELNGDGQRLGIRQKVAVMWRVHVWIIALVSAGFGSLVTLFVQKLMHP